jgi:hypothetical protein
MPRVSAAMLIAALTWAPHPVVADEDSAYMPKPKSQQPVRGSRARHGTNAWQIT